MSKLKPATVSKPRPDFPLFPHATGRWAKKVLGKLEYFGSTADDPNGAAALQRWLDEKDDLLGGRRPQRGDGVTCRDLCNSFLASKEMLVDAGAITRSHWKDYHRCCERIVNCFGRTAKVASLRPEDFDRLWATIAAAWGPIALGNEVQRIRSIFKWGHDTELLDRPVRFGLNFRRPSKKLRRLARKATGPKLFSAVELRQIIDTAQTPLKAMILLGINCAFGQHDIATLPITRLDLVHGWHSYERVKTGTDRRCYLWPETVAALKEAITNRPKPKNDADAELVFISDRGHRWVRCRDTGTWVDLLGKEFHKLVLECGIAGKGKSFYSLRRTFRTIADDAGDQPATVFIMGHADDDDDMSAIYRQSIDDDRLRAVTDHVRRWLWPPKRKRKAK